MEGVGGWLQLKIYNLVLEFCTILNIVLEFCMFVINMTAAMSCRKVLQKYRKVLHPVLDQYQTASREVGRGGGSAGVDTEGVTLVQ